MVVNEEGLKWALVNLKEIIIDHFRERSIDDFGWLDSEKIGGGNERHMRWDRVANDSGTDQEVEKTHASFSSARRGKAEGLVICPEWVFFALSTELSHVSVTVKTEVLRELYAFCWLVLVFSEVMCTAYVVLNSARVSHTKVEQQLKSRGIPWTSIFSTAAANTSGASQSHSNSFSEISSFSPTARSVPKIWIKIGDIIRSRDVSALACDNVKMKVVDWWSERPCRVSCFI